MGVNVYINQRISFMKFGEIVALVLVVLSIAIILLLEIVDGAVLYFLYALDFAIALALLYDYLLRVQFLGVLGF
ncbi:MAG: hypothetical protein PWQ22_1342 [Archaeoglobaceae archaeon]|nr:hypothetical protein [Archaeoglobaceae archaeon]